MGAGDREETLTDGTVKPTGEDTGTANADPQSKEQAPAPVPGTSDTTTTDMHKEEASPCVECSTTNDITVSVGNDEHALGAKNKIITGDSVSAGDGEGGGDNDDEYDDDNDDDDDFSSSFDGARDSDSWGDVEAGERTGYSGAEVEPFAVKEDINGSLIMEVCETGGGRWYRRSVYRVF